ncbi:MAG TPA: hypothetical protein VFK59_03630 [Actinomycetota bacterium]|nr:hypothetical protein [Actinomycetota bacterium]
MRRVVASLVVGALVASLGGLAWARPATTYTGVWAGDTNQDKIVGFRVNDDGELTRFRIKFDIHGDNCVLHTTAVWTGSRPIKNDRFRVHLDDLDGAATFVGRFFRGDEAKGTYKSTSNILSGCAGHVNGTWSAAN